MNSIIEVKGLYKTFRVNRQNVEALKGVSFSIEKGSITGFLGPNGAGKTTLIKCLCSLIIPDRGVIYIDGKDIVKHPNFATKKISAVLEGNRNIYWRLTVKENLIFFSGLMGKRYKGVSHNIDEVIDLFKLRDKENTQARFLSRGMQQKLAIACAFIKDTDILLLDEPTLGIDIFSYYELRDVIKEISSKLQKTVLLSTHDMSAAADICTSILIMDHGEIIVNKALKDIIDLSKGYTYVIKSELPLNEEQKEFINKNKDMLNATVYEDISIELTCSKSLSKVINDLKEANIRIETIERKRVDLEDIFVKLIRGES